MARLQSTREQFNVAAQATLAQTQAILVQVAKARHAEVMESDPRPGSFRRWVDGNEGAPEEAVKGDGVITYRYNRLDLVVQLAMETLFDLSPVKSGAYRNAHTIFLNGAAARDLKGYQSGDQIVISNVEPYARKIEVGVMKMAVPGSDHIYQQAQQVVSRRYGNVARVTFTFRGIVGPGLVSGKASNKSDLRYPALLISER